MERPKPAAERPPMTMRRICVAPKGALLSHLSSRKPLNVYSLDVTALGVSPKLFKFPSYAVKDFVSKLSAESKRGQDTGSRRLTRRRSDVEEPLFPSARSRRSRSRRVREGGHRGRGHGRGRPRTARVRCRPHSRFDKFADILLRPSDLPKGSISPPPSDRKYAAGRSLDCICGSARLEPFLDELSPKPTDIVDARLEIALSLHPSPISDVSAFTPQRGSSTRPSKRC